MRRIRKISLWVIGVLLGLAAVGWIGLQWYLSTAGARRMVSEEVSKILGMPVEVTSVNVGFGSTSVALVIPDPGSDPANPADLLRAGRIDTDITLGGLLTGSASPTKLTLRDADITLRMDADRKLISPLPKFEGEGGGKLPAVTLDNVRVRIRRPGQPEFDVGGVSGKLHADGEGYSITGNISDKNWGEWRLDGKLGADPADGQVTLTCDATDINDGMLRSIPFVKPKVWKHLSATGTTAAKVSLAFKPDGDFKYDVTVTPKGATLTLPDADVTLTQVAADIRIADGKVIAGNGRLTLAGGQATVPTGVFDFDRDEYLLTLKATASGLNVRQLPASWGLPKELEGKLKGHADLEIHFGDAKIETLGNGVAEVQNAKIAGIDAEIKFYLKGENGRYRFDSTPAQ